MQDTNTKTNTTVLIHFQPMFSLQVVDHRSRDRDRGRLVKARAEVHAMYHQTQEHHQRMKQSNHHHQHHRHLLLVSEVHCGLQLAAVRMKTVTLYHILLHTRHPYPLRLDKHIVDHHYIRHHSAHPRYDHRHPKLRHCPRYHVRQETNE
jgi:hypothetical protein